VILASVKEGKLERGLELLSQMKEDGVEPELATWKVLVAACANGSIEYARSLFNQMKKSGTAIPWALLLKAAVRMQDPTFGVFRHLISLT